MMIHALYVRSIMFAFASNEHMLLMCFLVGYVGS